MQRAAIATKTTTADFQLSILVLYFNTYWLQTSEIVFQISRNRLAKSQEGSRAKNSSYNLYNMMHGRISFVNETYR